MNGSNFRRLPELARLHGIQTSYRDVAGRTQHASPETLRALLELFGLSIGDGRDLGEELRKARENQWRACLDPVAVAWNGHGRVPFRLPANLRAHSLPCRLKFEDGTERRWSEKLGEVEPVKRRSFGYSTCLLNYLTLPKLPLGYHILELETPGAVHRGLVIAAPPRCYIEPGSSRRWGLFLPMYACRSEAHPGAGNFSDWQRLSHWTAALGGSIVGTLPLSPLFLDQPFEPSPYSPVSRMFWNEFYIDVAKAPELASCPRAQRLLRSGISPSAGRAGTGENRFVNWREEMAGKRKVLECLARHFFANDSSRRREFERFLRKFPALEDYACFRAVGDQTQIGWPAWPDRLRAGHLRAGDYSERVKCYHLYVQWLAQEQMDEILAQGRRTGVKLYLDLPLGVNPAGYDAWRHQKEFVQGAAVGAPPDTFFTKGQNWGFAPLLPAATRASHYTYVLQILRFQMRHTGLLRLDHVMGLHRLYWIPSGMPANQGAYVTYPAEEFYALLALESHRHQTEIVGENLGTVPPMVNRSMERHGLRKMYVLQYELQPSAAHALRLPPGDCAASLNTHDMPPFTAFWKGLDIRDRSELGLVKALAPERRARRQLTNALTQFLRRKGWLGSRTPTLAEVLEATLRFLSASEAEIVLLNLEDLWLEREAQNVPGTSRERPNWRRKARFGFEEFSRQPELLRLLAHIDELRKQEPRRAGRKRPARSNQKKEP